MGMFNEIYKKCPRCGKECVGQIPQIVLGFGEFNLDDPKSISERLRTPKEFLNLMAYCSEVIFTCDVVDDGCNNNFNALSLSQELG
jgi:hypothetical protein